MASGTFGTSILGETLGHYRVVEQVGAGGMGMVFRASDQELERDVAIKVLPPGMLAEESARKRFRREALTLAKLNHPNIATVYEFGSQHGLDYLVMEFVGGISLDAKLGTGPLSQKDVLRLGIQLADGLAGAHEHGVVHRDLKPSNLRLSSDNRLKILDFGLAEFVRQDSDLGITASIAEARQVAGTLPYMSPEQLRAETTDQRSDIWSAGAVLYELVTGKRPFPSSNPPSLIDSILNKAPDLPSSVNPKVAPGLEMAILKCLDKEPERRYQSAKELRIDLERLTLPLSHGSGISAASIREELQQRRTRRKWPVFLAGAALASIFVAALLFYVQPKKTLRVHPGIARRRAVAVLNMRNSAARADADWLSTALPEMLTTELAAGEKLRTITGEQVAQMKMNLSLTDSDALSPQSIPQIGKSLGADLLVVGSYVALGNGQLRVDLHLLDAITGEHLMAVAETGEENQVFDLIARAGAQLREKCNAGQMSPRDEEAVRAAVASNTEASKLYAEGLAKLRLNEAVAARQLLEKAVEADPNYALAHAALAAAWNLLGYDERARLSAKSAFELSGSLSREERLLTEARYREASQDWGEAAENYRTLFGFFPDNLEYGLRLANVQSRAGRGKDALATVESLRRLSAPEGQDPRIDLAESQAWRFSGDFKQSAASADAAAQRATQLGAKLIVARALYQKGFALENLGETDSAMSAVEQSARIYEAVGDRNGMASTFEVAGQVLLDRSDYPTALRKFNDELSIAREVGNRRAEASALNNIGNVLRQQGKEEEARTMFEKSLPVFREISDKSNAVQVLVNIGGILQDGGDLAGAKKTFEQALQISHEIEDRSEIALSLLGMGTVLDELGDSKGALEAIQQAMHFDETAGQTTPTADKLIALGDALRHLGDMAAARRNDEIALASARATGDKSTIAYAEMSLGELELKSANLPAARRDYEEALSLRQQLGEKETLPATRIALAELCVEEGHPDDAIAALEPLREELNNAKRKDDLIKEEVVLTEALLAKQKTRAANQEIAMAARLAAQSKNFEIQLAFALARARILAADRQPTPAIATLKEVLAKATKSGYLEYQLEARRQSESIQLQAGNSASRARLEILSKEAAEKGFILIARKAAAM